MRPRPSKFRPAAWVSLLLAGCAAPDAAGEAAAAREALVARHDRDRDGVVRREEYDRGEESFAALDRDGDGIVTTRDLERPVPMPPSFAVPLLLVRCFGGPEADRVSWEQVEAGVAAADSDGDARLARAELEAFLLAAGAAPGPDRFGPLCAGADRDGDGLLARAELHADFHARDLDHDGVLQRMERARTGPEPRVGWIEPHEREPAPDFVLPAVPGGQPVALADLHGRPLALVFGSFS